MAEERYARGWRTMIEAMGEPSKQTIADMNTIAPDMGRFIVEFPFGDIYSRPGLDLKTRELVTVAALTTLGHALPQLKVHIQAALRTGSTREEVLEVIMQMAVYAGFPAAINGLYAAREVFEQLDQDSKSSGQS